MAMTLATHPSAYGKLEANALEANAFEASAFEASALFRTPPATTPLPTGHRAASWLNAGITAVFLATGAALWSAAVPGRWLVLSVTMVSVTFAVLLMRGYFRVRMVPDALAHLPLVVVAVATGASAAMLVIATPLLDEPEPSTFSGLLAAVFVAATSGQAFGMAVVRQQWRKGNLRAAAIIVGSDALAREMAIEIDLRRDYGVDVVGMVPDGAGYGISPSAWPKDLSLQLALRARQSGADRIIITPTASADERQAVKAARWALRNGLAVYVVPRLYQMGVGTDSMVLDRARGYPLVRVERAAHRHLSLLVKRAFDVTVASAVLLTTLPVTALVALLVKASSPGPVFFAQERVGHHGRRILIHKFRSMTMSETSDTEWTADSRVTTVGHWIRRLNIDELPQLWAIIRGDMSLVGPRPERPAFVRQFTQEIEDYDDRHRMPAGLTGLAQIAGLRGDTSITERIKYDNLYIDQWSFGTDLLILAKTAAAILRQKRDAERIGELEQAMEAASSRDQSGLDRQPTAA